MNKFDPRRAATFSYRRYVIDVAKLICRGLISFWPKRAGGPAPAIRGTLDSPLVPGGSATMSVSNGQRVTVHDWLLAKGQMMAAGSIVAAWFDYANNRYYVLTPLR